MNVIRSQCPVLAFCLAAALTAACGAAGSASLSPLAPSAASSGATISGRVSGPSVAPIAATAFGAMEARGVTITVVGTGISTTADSQGQFTLNNVPAGTVQLNISAAGSSATVTISGVGPNDRVEITVTVNGSNARVDSEHHSKPDENKREFQGRITSIDAAGRAFRMSDMTVKVPASAAIHHGTRTLQFTDLKVGDHVEVRGTKDGTTITATEIKVESGDEGNNDDEKDGDNNDRGAADVQGVVSELAGTCPIVTFKVQTTKVSASSTTSYDHGSCAAVRNAVRVQVKGTKQSDGSIVATRISVGD